MAALPHFFHDAILKQGDTLWLDEPTSRHVAQVLRMQPGERLQLTDGRGNTATVIITVAEKKKCSVVIEQVLFHKEENFGLHLCIAFTKNNSRNEWLLEKATELGVRSIIPLLSAHTERDKTKHDRWRGILISALLQSQQYYLPHLADSTTLPKVLEQSSGVQQKLIAHCITGRSRSPLSEVLKPGMDTILLIGPEGDFTPEEVTLCEGQGFSSVSMGTQRLRTETAAMAACAFFNLINHGKG